MDGGCEQEHAVVLHVYDLSRGLAAKLSKQFLGIELKGIWHTGVVVYGYEYFFGGGIVRERPQDLLSIVGSPTEVLNLGFTQVPQLLFEEYLVEISPRYTMATYSVLSHNCNNFSDQICDFLLGKGIPGHITGLPSEVLRTPLGSMLGPLVQHFESSMKESLPGMHRIGADAACPSPSTALLQPPVGPLRGTAQSPSPLTPLPPPVSNGLPFDASFFENLSSILGGGVGSQSSLSGSASSQEPKVPQEPVNHWHNSLNDLKFAKRRTPLFSDKGSPVFSVQQVLKMADERRFSLSVDDRSILERLMPVLAQPGKGMIPSDSYRLFEKLLRAEPETLFPVLYLFRLFVRYPAAAVHFTVENPSVTKRIISLCSNESGTVPEKVQTMAFCVLVNLFSADRAISVLVSKNFLRSLLRAVMRGSIQENDGILQTSGTLSYNLALSFPRDDRESLGVFVSMLVVALSRVSKRNARMFLMALPPLLYCNDRAIELIKELDFSAERFLKWEDSEARSMAQEVVRLLGTKKDVA